MESDFIFITLTFEKIAPDTEADAQEAVKTTILESALLANFGPEIEVTFEQRAPILSTLTAMVAALKLPFKDTPDTASNIRKFYSYVRRKLLRQVQVREVRVKTKFGEYIIKTDDPVKIETPDFAIILKPRQ